MKKFRRKVLTASLCIAVALASVIPAFADDDFIVTYEGAEDETWALDETDEVVVDDYEYDEGDEVWVEETSADTDDSDFSIEDNTAPVSWVELPEENDTAEASAEDVEEEEEEIPEGMVKSYLTGEYVTLEEGRRRPIAFMIDNVKDSWPQSGIVFADLFYECEVESDLSRICAVFEKYDDLTKIGPLRSCRDYFISLVSGLDPIYEHYGQAAYALPYLESDDVDNVSGMMSYADQGFYRDGPFSAPHNCYTSAEGMQKMIEICGYSQDYSEDYEPMLTFSRVGKSVDMSEGEEASYVKIGYPLNDPRFVYNSATGLYERYQYGARHTDLETGYGIQVKNIILEYQNGTKYQDSSYLHYETTGEGRGKYITNGKAVDIRWSRENFFAPVRYTLEDGTPLVLNTGKTWVNVIRNEQMDKCLIGSSEDDLSCVVSDEEAAAAIKENEEWTAAYKEGELEYLTKMAQERTDNVAKHNGETKVEKGLP